MKGKLYTFIQIKLLMPKLPWNVWDVQEIKSSFNKRKMGAKIET